MSENQSLKKSTNWIGWIILSIILLMIPIGFALKNRNQQTLPVLGVVPSAQLRTQNDQPFSPGQMETVWVTNFIFTSCSSICPKLSEEMSRIQDGILDGSWPKIKLVSITVDPNTDTPERLLEYALAHDANLSVWTFVTGEPEAIEKAVVKGFKIGLQNEPPEEVKPEEIWEIVHGGYFVLVDAKGQIRGYFDVMSEGIDPLKNAASLLKGS